MTKKTKKAKPAEADYKLTERERAVFVAFCADETANPQAPRWTVSKVGDTATIAPDHPFLPVGHLLLMDALGTKDWDFTNGIVRQLVLAGPLDEDDEEIARRLNFMLSIVKGLKPRDQVETMLAAQMAAIHTATMNFVRRLASAKTSMEQDFAERTLNKLARTFVAQMEALKRHRAGGEQRDMVARNMVPRTTPEKISKELAERFGEALSDTRPHQCP